MRILIIALLLISTPAFSQQQLDAATWQRIVAHVATERDAAVAAAAQAEVKVEQLTKEIDSLKKELEQLRNDNRNSKQ